jgi:isopentenyl-diphosphate delta-isomerase
LGVKVSAPFGIGAMTGGTELAGKINAELAKAAEEFGYLSTWVLRELR